MVVRRDTGKPIPTRKGATKSYRQTSLAIAGKRVAFRIHVIKFALKHGYIPPMVDHRDRDFSNNDLENLRPAVSSRNVANSSGRSGSSGVRRRKSGRYGAYGSSHGQQVALGTYDTEEEALEAVRWYRVAKYGDFYAGR